MAGRQRLCKVFGDDISLSSHCPGVSDESTTSAKDDGGYSEASSTGCQGFNIKRGQDKISSKNMTERNYDVDEINSRLDSLSIKSSKRVEHSITAEVDNAEPSLLNHQGLLNCILEMIPGITIKLLIL
jgi:hypothetical protein